VTFQSIVFERPEDRAGVDQREAPACFGDLNLDQVIDSITAGREEYGLKPFFYTPLRDPETITYRHQILRDLEGKALWECVSSFAQKLRSMREHLAQADKLYDKHQKESWFLDAVEIYVDAVTGLRHGLNRADAKARGLLALREYLSSYVESPEFTALAAETAKLKEDLAAVTYCLQIQENRITVSKYESEADYAAEVEDTFEKFKRGATKDYRVRFPAWPEMNHIEAGVLDRVALLYPDVFSALDSYRDRHRDYLDRPIADFDREVQFYVACLEYVHLFRAAGLSFCYPSVSNQSKDVDACDTFDLALAHKLIREQSPVVCNDFSLKAPERILVVTGPNQGGKTTFARTFGQLHYLASIGCLVPGSAARLFLFDRLLTHFEREEDLANLRGKLEDDLVRIHEILRVATARSIVIMNEIFTSTTFRDARFLGKKVLERMMRLDLLCVCVTFVDELASLSETTVSMVSTVARENAALRTYKIVRRPADGRAYAAAIAEKYGLGYERLKERIAR
jgi:DNA mismatch repair ATPase MutS